MVALLIADSFNRADNPTSLGNTDGTGTLDPVAWSQDVGSWGIISNQAYTSVSTALAKAVVETGHSNVDCRLKLGSSGLGSTGLLFRYSDSNNFWRIDISTGGSLSLVKTVAGSSTTVSTSFTSYTSGDLLRVTAINNVITVYKNGVAVCQWIESFNRSATKCGMLSTSNTTARLEDFAVYSVSVHAELSTDSFDRVNSTSLGNTDGAGSLDPIAWQAQGGSSFLSDIVSNTAQVGASSVQNINPTGVNKQCNINYIEASVSDVNIYMQVSAIASSVAGIVFRYVDSNNYWLFYADNTASLRLYKIVGGVWTAVTGSLTGLGGVGRVMSIRLAGSTIVCEALGLTLATVSDTDLQSATKHGFMIGTSSASIDSFEMLVGDPAIPVIAQIGPTQGEAAGGTDVTIVGNNFTTATQVLFGSTPATSFTIISDTFINAVAPAHAVGLTHISVVNPAGSSAIGSTDQFTYFIPDPIVSSVTPNHGSPAGGTSVVITGAYFTGATSVKFGTVEAASYTVNNDGQITATTPAHAAGVTPVIVTTPYGSN